MKEALKPFSNADLLKELHARGVRVQFNPIVHSKHECPNCHCVNTVIIHRERYVGALDKNPVTVECPCGHKFQTWD